MKKGSLFLALSLILLLLFSCQKEEFSVSSVSLKRVQTYQLDSEGGLQGEEEAMTLVVSSSSKEALTFKLTSPDGTLYWEGRIKSGDDVKSDNLLLTQGARFPEGEYSVVISSSDGQSVNRAVKLSESGVLSSELPCFLPWSGLRSDDELSVKFKYANGRRTVENKMDSGSIPPVDAISAEMTILDSNFNEIVIIQELSN